MWIATIAIAAIAEGLCKGLVSLSEWVKHLVYGSISEIRFEQGDHIIRFKR